MKKHIHLLPIATLASALAFAEASGPWTDPAARSADSTGATLYYFRSQGAILCREVEEDVWTDQRISGALARVKPVWVDASQSENRTLVESLGVYVVPTTVLVDGEREVGRVKLSTSREDYLDLLARAGIVSPSEFRRTAPTPAPAAAAPTGAPAVLRAEVADPAGDSPDAAFDIVALRVGNEGSNLLVHATLAGAPDETWGSGFNIFVDVDGSSTTGFSHDLFSGADYLLQGAGVMRFGGSEPRAWLWNGVGAGTISFARSSVSIRVPHAMLGIDASTPVRIVANTQDKGWQSLDWAPASGYLEAGGPGASPAAAGAPAGSDPRGDAGRGLDLVGAAVRSGAEGISIAISFDEPSAHSERAQVFFDTDANPATGFSGPVGSGADWLLEGANLHRYAAAQGNAWTWTQVATVASKKEGATWQVTIPSSHASPFVAGKAQYWIQSIDETWSSADRMPDAGAMTLH